MISLTFGEQVKIVLSRKDMTIKELAEEIEARTGKKMSRQNLTQRLGRDMVFSNTHDGSGAIKVALTPIRVVCNNTLNLALSSAKRSWSMIHTGDIQGKLEEAKDTLFKAEAYMDELGKEIEDLRMKRMSDQQVLDYIEILLQIGRAHV